MKRRAHQLEIKIEWKQHGNAQVQRANNIEWGLFYVVLILTVKYSISFKTFRIEKKNNFNSNQRFSLLFLK